MKYLIIAISCLLLLSLALGVSYIDAYDYAVATIDGFSRAIDTIKYVFSPESFKASLYNTQNGGSYKTDEGEVIDPYIEITLALIGNGMAIDQMYGKMWSLAIPTLLPNQYTDSDFVRVTVTKTGKNIDVFYAPNGFTYYGDTYEVIEVRGGVQYFYKKALYFKNGQTGADYGDSRIGFISPREQTITMREWFSENFIKE